MSPKAVVLNDVDDPRGIGYEEDRAQHGALRDTGSDCHCLGGSSVEPDELSAAREVGLNPLNDSSCDAGFVYEPLE